MTDLPFTIEAVAAAGPMEDWHGDCHAVSLAIIRAGLVEGRVARGSCTGVPSQHSWIALGDCYDRYAPIIDPTLWCYRDDVDGIWTGSIDSGLHEPHGYGSIWAWGRPRHGDGPDIEIDHEGLSSEALSFLQLVEPLDLKGWSTLAHAPVLGWPAAEIIDRLADHPQISTHIPIDRVGMLTDRNPKGLYLKTV